MYRLWPTSKFGLAVVTSALSLEYGGGLSIPDGDDFLSFASMCDDAVDGVQFNTIFFGIISFDDPSAYGFVAARLFLG